MPASTIEQDTYLFQTFGLDLGSYDADDTNAPPGDDSTSSQPPDPADSQSTKAKSNAPQTSEGSEEADTHEPLQLDASGGVGGNSAPPTPTSASPLTPENFPWLQEAQNSVPWDKWPDKEKESAVYDYDIARKGQLQRITDPAARKDQSQETLDEQVIALLKPYHEDIKAYAFSRTTLWLSADVQKAAVKQTIHYEAHVVFQRIGTPVKTGAVRFDHVGLGMQQLGKVPVKDGVATFSQSFATAGKHVVQAEYVPDDKNVGSSDAQVEVEVTGQP